MEKFTRNNKRLQCVAYEGFLHINNWSLINNHWKSRKNINRERKNYSNESNRQQFTHNNPIIDITYENKIITYHKWCSIFLFLISSQNRFKLIYVQLKSWFCRWLLLLLQLSFLLLPFDIVVAHCIRNFLSCLPQQNEAIREIWICEMILKKWFISSWVVDFIRSSFMNVHIAMHLSLFLLQREALKCV